MLLRLHHVSIPVGPGQLDAGRTFYTDSVGLEEIEPPKSLGRERVAWFALGEHELHLFIEAGANTAGSGQHLAIEVDDLDAMRERLSIHGVTIEEATPIHDRPRFFFRDPFGNRVEVTRVLGPYR